MSRSSMGRVSAQWKAETSLLMRNGEQLLLTIIIPLILLVFFGSVDVLPLDGYDDPLDVIVPGVIAVAVMSSSMVSLGIATGFERSYLVLKRLGATPLSRGQLIVAKALSVSTVQLVQGVLLVGVGLAMGWSPAGNEIALAIPAVVLGTLAFAGIGLLLAGSLRAEINLAAQNGLYLVLLLAGGMIIPRGELPAGISDIATYLPSHALAAVLQRSLNGWTSESLSAWVVLTAWAVIAPTIAARRFKWW